MTPKPAGLSRNVRCLGLVSFLNDFSSEIIFPLLPAFFVGVLGGSRAALGQMEGLVETVASLLKLWSGRYADRLERRKPLVVAGYALASFVRPFIAIAAAPWHVVMLRVLDRIGKGVRGAPRDALIADSTPADQRGWAFGFHRAMDHAGAMAGPLTALALIPLFQQFGVFQSGELAPRDYRLMFALAAVPALASVVILVLLVREPPRERHAHADGPPARLPRPFWGLLGILALFALGNSSDGFLLLRTYDFGLSLRDSYLIWALLHVVKSALSGPAGALSDRIPRRILIGAGWLVYALVYLGFGFAVSAWQIWVLFAAYGLYFGLVEGVEKALVADLVPKEQRGTAFGWYHAAIGIAALPASVLLGALWDAWGPRAAFGFGASLALLAVVLLWLAAPRAARLEPAT